MTLRLWVVLCAGLGALPVSVEAQRSSDSAAVLDKAAVQAYRTKDYGAFTTLERQALALDPDNPRYLYDVACGEALQGRGIRRVRLRQGETDDRFEAASTIGPLTASQPNGSVSVNVEPTPSAL